MDQMTQQKRAEILEDMRQIQRLRQGTLSEQFYGTDTQPQGPYYVLQGYTKGRHWSKRVPRDQVAQVRADLAAGVRLQELCSELAVVTEQATQAEDEPGHKKKAPPPNKTATAKPKPF